jgi:hypothetical protein
VKEETKEEEKRRQCTDASVLVSALLACPPGTRSGWERALQECTRPPTLTNMSTQQELPAECRSCRNLHHCEKCAPCELLDRRPTPWPVPPGNKRMMDRTDKHTQTTTHSDNLDRTYRRCCTRNQPVGPGTASLHCTPCRLPRCQQGSPRGGGRSTCSQWPACTCCCPWRMATRRSRCRGGSGRSTASCRCRKHTRCRGAGRRGSPAQELQQQQRMFVFRRCGLSLAALPSETCYPGYF